MYVHIGCMTAIQKTY